jgi:hypothetical protein
MEKERCGSGEFGAGIREDAGTNRLSLSDLFGRSRSREKYLVNLIDFIHALSDFSV